MQASLGPSELFPAGPLRCLGRSFYHFESIESTNDFLLRLAATPRSSSDAHRPSEPELAQSGADRLHDGSVAVAEYQAAGRGRLGRRWVAPRRSSILLSALVIEPEDSPVVRLAPFLACLAACEAVDAETDCRAYVRWPNDVTLGGRKLGGVLVESTPSPIAAPGGPKRRAVVVGVGLNCLQQAGHFAGPLAQHATSLEIESRQPVDRCAVARTLVQRLDDWLHRVRTTEDAAAAVRSAWLERCEDLGAHVTLVQDGVPFSGTVVDISDDGDLHVQLDQGGRRAFAAATTTRCW